MTRKVENAKKEKQDKSFEIEFVVTPTRTSRQERCVS